MCVQLFEKDKYVSSCLRQTGVCPAVCCVFQHCYCQMLAEAKVALVKRTLSVFIFEMVIQFLKFFSCFSSNKSP